MLKFHLNLHIHWYLFMIGPWIDGVRESDHWPKFLSLGFNIIWEILRRWVLPGRAVIFFCSKNHYTNSIDMTINKSTNSSNINCFLPTFVSFLHFKIPQAKACSGAVLLPLWVKRWKVSFTSFWNRSEGIAKCNPQVCRRASKNTWHFEKKPFENRGWLVLTLRKVKNHHTNWERAMTTVIRRMMIFIDSMNSPSAKWILRTLNCNMCKIKHIIKKTSEKNNFIINHLFFPHRRVLTCFFFNCFANPKRLDVLHCYLAIEPNRCDDPSGQSFAVEKNHGTHAISIGQL